MRFFVITIAKNAIILTFLSFISHCLSFIITIIGLIANTIIFKIKKVLIDILSFYL